jgi:hypothetical protein
MHVKNLVALSLEINVYLLFFIFLKISSRGVKNDVGSYVPNKIKV